MPPRPQARQHLEQADGDRRVAGYQHPLTTLDHLVEALDQDLPVGVGDAQVTQHQLSLVRLRQADAMVLSHGGPLFQQ
ncbi:hypothetical protein D3C72_2318170 [compost metagenome]